MLIRENLHESKNTIKNVRRGQIYIADMSLLYSSDGRLLNANEKVLIIQNNKGNKYSGTTIAVLIKNENVDVHSINTIDKQRLIKKIGEIGYQKMNFIENQMINALLIINNQLVLSV